MSDDQKPTKRRRVRAPRDNPLRPELWHTLNNQQLRAVINGMKREDPIGLIGAWAQVVDRLPADTLNDLLQEVIRSQMYVDVHQDCDRLVAELMKTPLRIRLPALQGLKKLRIDDQTDNWWDRRVPALELLLHTLFELSYERAIDVFIKTWNRMEELQPVIAYRTILRIVRRREIRTTAEVELSMWLLEWLKAMLRNRGYRVAKVSIGQRDGEPQWYIDSPEGVRYLLYRRAHYFPQDGERVLFKVGNNPPAPGKGRLVLFYPADPPE